MKIKKSELKTSETAYLYSDGHMVLVHRKRDNDAGYVNWVTIYEKVTCNPHFEGRLIIKDGALPFVLNATSVRATEASVKGGSDNTKKMGISVGCITLINGTGKPFFINTMPEIISSDFTYQPDIFETFEQVKDAYHWCNYTVKEVYREPV